LGLNTSYKKKKNPHQKKKKKKHPSELKRGKDGTNQEKEILDIRALKWKVQAEKKNEVDNIGDEPKTGAGLGKAGRPGRGSA